ncbi:MAG: hypothetical protein KKD38_08675, partial [Candidatus Delongbacteria bacterium]|nr:hypothetical protein [Candidatus Delongbacteria bacterium]
LSWSQKKTKVEYAETWENFDNAEGGAIPPGWEVKTQYAYPPGNGPELHYWRTTDNTNIYDTLGIANPEFSSNDLRTSSATFSSQRFEILSPVIEIPALRDSVSSFLIFDYARELLNIFFTNGARSLMVMQYCDEGGNMLPYEYQPIGSMDATETLDDGSHYPLTGYPLNLSNFFLPNIAGIHLYPDGIWLKMTFGLAPPFTTMNLQEDKRKIRVKFIQYFNNDFVGIIDNWDTSSGTPIWSPSNFILNPPDYTDLTIHHFDNFIVKTYYDINLPPTVKAVADQEVIQHCGWQTIELTGISNGQGAILGDYEEIGTDGKGILKDIVKINSVEETENGTLKITALVRDDKDLKEISFDPNALKASKFPTQQVIEMKITSSNEKLLPLDSLKYEFTPGADKVDLYYKPVDTENGETELKVWLKDNGGIEHNGRDTTAINFKVNVIPFNAPKYDPPITELTGITEDFPELNINLGDHFKDAEGDPIIFSMSADTALVDITLNEDVLKIKSKKDVFGTGLLTIMADDKSGAIPTIETININIVDDGTDFEFEDQYVIINEDDIPVKNLPDNFEPESMDLTAMFNSESANAAVFSLSLDNEETLNAAISGNNINLTAIQDSMGVAIASIGITINGMQYNTKLKFVVGNFPPVIKAEIADIETPANFKTMNINLKDHYTDPNKDWLGYSVRTTQSKIDTYISFYDDQLIIESKANESGIDSLFISIYDGEFTVRDSLKITIGTPTTQVPYLTAPIEDFHAKEDFGRQEIDLNNHFADPAGTGIAYVVDFDSTKVKCSIEDGHLLVITSVKNFHGYAPMSVGIADGKKVLRPSKFEGCDPKNVVRVIEKIKKKK